MQVPLFTVCYNMIFPTFPHLFIKKSTKLWKQWHNIIWIYYRSVICTLIIVFAANVNLNHNLVIPNTFLEKWSNQYCSMILRGIYTVSTKFSSCLLHLSKMHFIQKHTNQGFKLFRHPIFVVCKPHKGFMNKKRKEKEVYIKVNLTTQDG